MTTQHRSSREGSILASAVAVLAILAIMAGSVLTLSLTMTRRFAAWRSSDESLLVAQSALERTKYEIYDKFYDYFISNPPARTSENFHWFGETREGTIMSVGTEDPYIIPDSFTYENGQAWVRVDKIYELPNKISTYKRGPYELKITATAEVDGKRRSVTEVVCYELTPSRVFDYTYFINNFGWFYGSTITAHGDVRANGDFELRYGPLVNGDIDAAGDPALGSLGSVSGDWRHWDIDKYLDDAPSTARPTDPTDPDLADDTQWPMGYDGESETLEYLDPVVMPYLGDLSDYKYLATGKGGTINQGGATLVSAVYTGAGPDTVSGSADDGCLILVGTAANPIQISGPVVVEGDLIIKGAVSGQGTIYAGRNIHIAGDVYTVDPPNWPKPDPDPETTSSINKDKDLLIMACKGNVIIGDYTQSSWLSNVERYMKPSFTSSYSTDASDYDLGYDSDWNPANGYTFSGNYTSYDGGKRVRYNYDGTIGEANRRYYQSSIDDGTFHAISNGEKVDRLDAVVYNNHIIAGYLGSLKCNGSLIGRDEALIFSGSITMTWDIRVGSESRDAIEVDIELPRDLSEPRTRFWRENS
jgi:hypothetical protein